MELIVHVAPPPPNHLSVNFSVHHNLASKLLMVQCLLHADTRTAAQNSIVQLNPITQQGSAQLM